MERAKRRRRRRVPTAGCGDRSEERGAGRARLFIRFVAK